MRIASTQYHSAMNAVLQDNNAKLAELGQQMSSGNRLNVPSDDPIASVRLLRLEREEAAIGQYLSNITALSTRLSLNEAHLDSISNDMMQMRDLLVWAADGSNTAADLQAMGSSLKSLRDSLVFSANVRDQEGRYLFSGTANGHAAIKRDVTTAVYSFGGNEDTIPVVVGHGVSQVSNTTLAQLPDMLNQLEALIVKLDDPALTAAAVGDDVRKTLGVLDSAHQMIGSKIAQQGGAQNIIKMMADNHSNVSLANQKNATDIGRLDYAEAFIKMNAYTLALQASQKAYGKVSQLTLFNVI
ncbi:flagellar hook-associated protein FlgL [Craterilacuibacter sinensis]|uniref:Flagellar hook-associated protein 3 n=1 Tax=Craterilacuibacter sinensis TaxID=2686017 RepID=A0A845BGH1_9NEIS|nr:flagellar hook-associated protein FlgL [Craterilacuibacter sinensis]MXR35837.1 flagellar hook-associated protein 3 [Craterilacuibacter sinensis]